MKSRFVVVLLLILVFQSLHAKALKRITLQLSWFDQFQFAGYYMAKERGFYEEVGLEVEIKPFRFGVDIPQKVSEGVFDFAVGRETLILERTENKNIVALYALFQATPLVLLSTKESQINTIDDFKNKRVMTTIDDSSEVSLKSMINSHNLQLNELTFLKHTHNIMDLVNKKTDVISAYLSKAPYELEKKGIAYNVFDPKKFGFDMYSDFLYTSERLISSDPNTVYLFKQASLKGWEYAYSNIQESAEVIYEKYNTQNLSKEELVFEGRELKKLSYFDTNILGEIKEEKLQRIYDLYNVMGLVKKQINIKEFLAQKNFSTQLKLTKKESEYLRNKGVIKMCMIPHMMPYADIKDDELIGFISDYTQLLEKKMQVSIEPIVTQNMDETLQFLQDKKCDMIPGVQLTPKRKEFLNFTKPYLKVPFVLITQKDQAFFSDMNAFKNKKISLIQGYAISELLKIKYPDVEFVDVESIEDGFKLIEEDKVFASIAPLAVALYAIELNGMKELKISGKLDEVNYIRIGVAKEDVVLYSILDKVINSIDSSVIETMLNKWLYSQEDKKFNFKLFLQLLSLFLLIIAAVLYRQHFLKKMNKELKQKVDEKTHELQLINRELEQRVAQEVEKNIKKDQMLSRQSKMAAMGEMIENIAHQWRQPLSIISTGASGMRLKKELNNLDDAFFFETVDTIIKTSHYLSTTIDDFRYFFKPNKDKAIFSLKRCCERSVELLKPKLRGIEIVLDLEDVMHFGFENEMVQVFMNMINNSKDALEQCSESKKYIFITVYQNNEGAIIEFKDNAGGIPDELLNKVSEPYFTTKHKAQGTGIGLYMCEEIISKHMNGVLDVSNLCFHYENIRCTGALFTITLYK